jgi:MFS family permease
LHCGIHLAAAPPAIGLSARLYGLTSVMGAMVAEIFQGRHFGGIFGTVMLSAMAGGAAGPWVTGVLHDALGDYALAFWLGAGVSVVSALAIWQASPRKVRAVAGRIRRVRPLDQAA